GIGVAFLAVLAVYAYRKGVGRKRVSMSGSVGGAPSGSASAGLSLVALGGLVAILGTLLPWVNVAFGPAHTSARAFGSSTGLFVMVLGGLLFARGVINARGSD